MNEYNAHSTDAKAISFFEFVTLLALSISLVALSIDSILPAFNQMQAFYAVERANDLQYLITFLFIGLSIGQFMAGPISDSIGRKPTLYIGLSIFIGGSILCYVASSFHMMLAGRFIQGLGAAAPRIVSTAIVRDRYEGRDMARVMSYIMGVFILVPVLAPSIGLGIMMISNWHFIFLFYILISIIIFIWGAMRLRETLAPVDRRPFTPQVIGQGMWHVISNKMSICYTLSSGLMFGGLLGYVNTSPHIFQNYYDTGDAFAIYFGLGAAALGLSFFVNARIVKRLGMRYVIIRSISVIALLSAAFIGYEYCLSGPVSLLIFMIYMMTVSFCLGLCFSNLNALAMVPMGHIAGIASSVVSGGSLIAALIASNIIGQSFTDTLYPLSIGFCATAFLSLVFIWLAEKTPDA